MGQYYFLSDWEIKSGIYNNVEDVDVRELFDEAKTYDSSLTIKDRSYFTPSTIFKKSRLINKYDIYHIDSGNQARLQMSGSGSKEVVVAYLYGIINGALVSENQS